MDPLSATVSASALLETLMKVGEWIKDVKDAPEELRKLGVEVDDLCIKLRELHEYLDNANRHRTKATDLWYTRIIVRAKRFQTGGDKRTDKKLKGYEHFPRLAEVIAELIEKTGPKTGHMARVKNNFRRLTWTWRKDDMKILLNKVEREKTNIILMLTLDIAETGKDTNVVAYKIEQGQIDDREERLRDKFIGWLSTVNFHEEKEIITSDKHPGTGQWLLNSEEFNAWIAKGSWTLLGTGPVGAGKTVISSFAINHLEENFRGENTPVLFLYLDHERNYSQPPQQLVEDLFANLLQQLVQHQSQYQSSAFLSSDLKEFYSKKKWTRPKLQDLLKILRLQITAYLKVYLVVDSVDECSDPSYLLNQLKRLYPDKVSLMVTRKSQHEENLYEVSCSTCRREDIRIFYHCNICRNGDFDVCQNCMDSHKFRPECSHELIGPTTVEIDIRAKEEDVRKYVGWEIAKALEPGSEDHYDRYNRGNLNTTYLGDNCRNDPHLERHITDTIAQNIRGVFLLAKLQMDSLKLMASHGEVLETLAALPTSIYSQYERMMNAINERSNYESNLAMTLLSWIVEGYRPLSFQELQYVLAVELDDTDLRRDKLRNERFFLEITNGLVMIDAGQERGQGNVHLVHVTALEYLKNTRQKWFPEAKTNMTRKILTYLLFHQLSMPCEEGTVVARLREHPFLAYAAPFWGQHVLDVLEEGHGSNIEGLVIRFVKDPQRLAASIQAARHLDEGNSGNYEVRQGANGLHICAWYGLDDLVDELLLHPEIVVDSLDSKYGQTALIYACKGGRAQTVDRLLTYGASVNHLSAQYSTPMLEAVRYGHADIVEKLVRKEELNINVTWRGKYNRTALMMAAQYGNKAMIGSLLKRSDIDINRRDLVGDTALSLAATTTNTEVINLLLERQEIEIDVVNDDGYSPIMVATRCGSMAVVNKLLQGGADSSIKDPQGSDIIKIAVDYGHLTILKSLVDQHIDFRGLDEYGRSLLHSASCLSIERDRSEFVQFLVNIGIDVNSQSFSGDTPLHDASRMGHLDAVQALLDLGAKRSIKNKYGRSPLSVAKLNGQLQAAKMLGHGTNEEDTNGHVDSNDEPLRIWSVVKQGRKDLVEGFIHEGGNIEEQDPENNNSALHYAISLHNDEIVEMLLDAKMSPDNSNNQAQTPLHFTAFYGNPRAARMLLQHHANMEALDRWNQTPLLLAQKRGFEDVAVALIEAGALMNSQVNARSLPTFLAAIEQGNTIVARKLIENGADVEAKTLDGKPAVQVARENGHEDLMSLLLKHMKGEIVANGE